MDLIKYSKNGDAVTLLLSVRNGTANHVLTLPEGFRPEGVFLAQAITTEGDTKYATIYQEGEILVPDDLIGKGVLINCSFYV